MSKLSQHPRVQRDIKLLLASTVAANIISSVLVIPNVQTRFHCVAKVGLELRLLQLQPPWHLGLQEYIIMGRRYCFHRIIKTKSMLQTERLTEKGIPNRWQN